MLTIFKPLHGNTGHLYCKNTKGVTVRYKNNVSIKFLTVHVQKRRQKEKYIDIASVKKIHINIQKL